MIIKNKERFIRYLSIIRYVPIVKYETENKDEELNKLINILNIKNRYKRINKIIEELSNYIDLYYKDCKLCDFKSSKCICHRNINKNYINGCCRMCLYQSDKGCTTKNVACKLFLCSHAIIDIKRLELNDIYISKLLNPYQRFVLSCDYFSTIEQVTMDLYVGPFCLLLRLIFRYISYFIKKGKNENIHSRKQHKK